MCRCRRNNRKRLPVCFAFGSTLSNTNSWVQWSASFHAVSIERWGPMVSYSRKDLFSSQWQDTFFDPVSYVCQFKRLFCKSGKWKFTMKIVKYHNVLFKNRSVNRVISPSMSPTPTWPLPRPKPDIKKKVNNLNKSCHIDNCSYVKVELDLQAPKCFDKTSYV